jgi:pyrroline-5-carboxylate reductase
MGTALVSGLIESKALKPSRIFVTDVQDFIRKTLAKNYRVSVGTDNASAVKKSQVVLLCVKPQQMGELLAEIRPVLAHSPLVISIAAGVRTDFIEKSLDNKVPVVRVMPNTPALVRAGALVYCLGRRVGKKEEDITRWLLSALGEVWKVSEIQMDAVTALSGSGPAYVFHLAECLAHAGRQLGLPESLVDPLARQTVYGAGLMLKESPEPASVLRHRVSSPGGTTEAALKVFAKAKWPALFEEALSAAKRRSQELSKH